MANTHFTLTTSLSGPMVDGPTPDRVVLDLDGFTPVVGAGDAVLKGTLVARTQTPGRGDLHAPIAGTVAEIAGLSEFSLVIDRQGDGSSSVDRVDLSALAGEELCCTLASLGVDTRSLGRARTLIVNAMPPEPGILVCEQLLRDYRPDVALGLETVKRIVSPAQVVLAGIGVDASALGSCAVKHLPPTYPAGLDPLVIKAVTGNETPKDTVILSVLDLYKVGRVAETGMPVTETVLTVGGGNVMALVGCPAGALLQQAGVSVAERDRVVLGGTMRGEALISIDAGITKNCLALTVIPHDAYPPVTDSPCINCGECVLACPSRVLPNLISRAAEFGLWERAEHYGALQCIECGLCGYHCPGRRPLLQYIRLAKKELSMVEPEIANLKMADAPKCC